MKEIIIIILILSLILGGNILINNYLKRSGNKLAQSLEMLKDSINNNDKKEIIRVKAEEIYKDWQMVEEKWAMFVLHSELDSIETSLIKMKVDIEKEDIILSLEELNTSVFLINHISEKEKFCLKNII